jgi:hypothetical protein
MQPVTVESTKTKSIYTFGNLFGDKTDFTLKNNSEVPNTIVNGIEDNELLNENRLLIIIACSLYAEPSDEFLIPQDCEKQYGKFDI